MPRDSNGTFSLVSGTLVSPGDTVLVSQHNPPLLDIAQGLSDSLDRRGSGGMLGPLGLNGFEVNGLGPINGNITLNRGTPTINFNTTGPRIYVPAESSLAFGKGQGNYNLLIDNNGQINVHGSRNTTGTISGGGNLRVIDASNGGTCISTFGSQNHTAINFQRGGSSVGGVVVNTASVSYNTSSDYRLKTNIVPLTGAVARVLPVPAHRFSFTADPGVIVDGFLAHEVALAVPEAVHGTKDAVDGDGNPLYQSIDQSKLVPVLWAAVQELAARVVALEARP